MYSDTAIVNLALSHLGHSKKISDLLEDSTEARGAASFFEFSREAVLEAHDWGFVSTREYLPLRQENYFGWRFAYGYPSSAVHIRAVHHIASPEGKYEYAVEAHPDGSRLILSNIEDAVVRYTRESVTGGYPVHFANPFAWRLAYHMSGTIIQNEVAQNMMWQNYLQALKDGACADARQMHVASGVHQPKAFGVRNGYARNRTT